jgi:glycosyltransferase involved in cell wall biosynthesis
MVSVVMITYGHEQFITQAIEGVLLQKCNFEIELIIANDCSPDRTDEIVKQLIQNHSTLNFIKYTKHFENKGMMANFVWSLNQSKGKYIALCEGDDYWNDPLKLQKQINFLEQNKEFSMCFHSVVINNSNLNYSYHFSIPKKSILELNDLILKHYIPTCSLVFRNDCLPENFPKWFELSIVGDIPLEILLAINGNAKYFDLDMAVYRKHDLGITSNIDHQFQSRWGFVKLYKNLFLYFRGRYFHFFIFMILKNIFGMFKSLLNRVFKKI